MLQLPHRRALLGAASRLPSWLPLGSGSVVPLLYADFAAGNYWYNNASYASFSAWMTAIGGVFARASSATYFDVTGTLQTATSNVARFAYDPVLHTALGLRLTGARTNLLLRSEQLDAGAWTVAAITAVTADATTSPKGDVTADKLTESGTTVALHGMYQGLTGTAASYTVSVYAKAAERSWLRVGMTKSLNVGVWFDLTNGVVGTTEASGGVGSIQSVGGGWYRCSVVKTLDVNPWYVTLDLGSADNTGTYAGVAGRGLYLWGTQVELGSFASDYIGTVAASATEAADSLIIGPTGGVPFTGFSAGAGTFIVETSIDAIAGVSSYPAKAEFNDNSANNAISTYYGQASNRHVGEVIASSAVQQTTGTALPTYAAGAFIKQAEAWQVNDFAAAVAGGTVATDASGSIPAVDRLMFGAAKDAGGPTFGYTKSFAYWPSRLSNADLTRLST